jgi:hypothetical protein
MTHHTHTRSFCIISRCSVDVYLLARLNARSNHTPAENTWCIWQWSQLLKTLVQFSVAVCIHGTLTTSYITKLI